MQLQNQSPFITENYRKMEDLPKANVLQRTNWRNKESNNNITGKLQQPHQSNQNEQKSFQSFKELGTF